VGGEDHEAGVAIRVEVDLARHFVGHVAKDAPWPAPEVEPHVPLLDLALSSVQILDLVCDDLRHCIDLLLKPRAKLRLTHPEQPGDLAEVAPVGRKKEVRALLSVLLPATTAARRHLRFKEVLGTASCADKAPALPVERADGQLEARGVVGQDLSVPVEDGPAHRPHGPPAGALAIRLLAPLVVLHHLQECEPPCEQEHAARTQQGEECEPLRVVEGPHAKS
jgi:hypothetical protein